MKTIDLAQLASVHGGQEDTYQWGYDTGKAVTEGLLALGAPKTACHQTGGPWLAAHGMPNAAKGAEQSVIDVCQAHGILVQ